MTANVQIDNARSRVHSYRPGACGAWRTRSQPSCSNGRIRVGSGNGVDSDELRQQEQSQRTRMAQRTGKDATDTPGERSRAPAQGTPHDHLFRAILSDSERAAAFLRDHLPNEIAGLLADTQPTVMEGTFVDEALAASQSDVLLRVELKTGRPAFVYVLAEHKSRPDPALPLQIASYMIRIWKRHAGDKAANLQALPPVIPVVVFHGNETWNVAASLTEMIATDDPALTFLPGDPYILRNLASMGIGELSRHAALRAGLITLKREALTHLAEMVAGLPQDSTFRRQIMEYILRVYEDLDIAVFRQQLRQVDRTNNLEALVGTIAETLIEQGKAEGLSVGEAKGLAAGKAEGLAAGKAEGLAAGKAEGLAAGKADILSRLLTRRFGALPRSIAGRIGAASLADLDRWVDAAIDAPSLDDVFGERRNQ